MIVNYTPIEDQVTLYKRWTLTTEIPTIDIYPGIYLIEYYLIFCTNLKGNGVPRPIVDNNRDGTQRIYFEKPFTGTIEIYC